MFFEWWMIAILIVASVGWGEYRFRDGKKQQRLTAKLEGGMNAVQHLAANGLISFEDDGTFVGKDGKTWNPLTNKVGYIDNK